MKLKRLGLQGLWEKSTFTSLRINDILQRNNTEIVHYGQFLSPVETQDNRKQYMGGGVTYNQTSTPTRPQDSSLVIVSVKILAD